MAAGHITVAPDSTGKNMDADALTSTEAGSPTVYREDVVISSPSTYGNKAEVNASGAVLVAQTGALPAGAAVIGHVIADTGSTTAVTGNVAVTSAGLTNIDVALSTRTKPADQQHAIIDSGTVTAVTAITNALPAGTNVLGHVIADTGSTTAVTGSVAVTNAGLTNIDVALSTRLKPADTLAAVTTVTAVTAITNALPAGTNVLGHVIVDSGAVTVTDATQLPASLGQKAMAASLPVVVASDQSALPDNLTQVGGAAIAIKALPTGASGQAALPVYTNAIQLLTYTYSFRVLATGILTANTAKAILSFDHAVSAAKTVKIRRILIAGRQTTLLAGALDIQVTTGVLQASAGTVITPGKRNLGDAAAELVCRSLPTITAATVQDNLPFSYDASAAVNAQSATVIYDWQEAGETKPWTLRAGVLESFVLNAISDVAQNWTLTIHVTVTEE